MTPGAASAGKWDGIPLLLTAQFLSAFADNALLFAVVALVRATPDPPDWLIPAIQSAFLVAFVVLAPWVGPLADTRPKPQILFLANLVKAAGAALLLAGLTPLLAYALVGAGAALYSPAKYGILPELAPEARLVRANGWIEGATILAIVLGPIAGAWLADGYSVTWALDTVLALYLASALLTLGLPRTGARRTTQTLPPGAFWSALCALLRSNPARFALIGGSAFWAAGAALRMMLIAWAPEALGLATTRQIAELTVFLAAGIVVGALLAPRLITLDTPRRALWALGALGLSIAALAGTTTPGAARSALFGAGLAGGVFIVPVNALLQQIGYQRTGSGSAVAVQRFLENLAMLLAVGLYTLAAARGADAATSMVITALCVALAAFGLSLKPRPGH